MFGIGKKVLYVYFRHSEDRTLQPKPNKHMPYTELLRIICAGIVAMNQIGNVIEKYDLETNPIRFFLGIATAIIAGVAILAIFRIAMIIENWYRERPQSRRTHSDS